MNGIFPETVNKAAFIDRGELSIWGKARSAPLGTVKIRKNIAIAGKKRCYARALHGTFLPTQNPFELRYARIRFFPRVAPFRLIVHSEGTPLALDEVVTMIDALFQKTKKVKIAYLEFTRDIQDVPINHVYRRIFSRARKRRWTRDAFSHRTFYIGSSRSGFQVRLYDKTSEHVRLELILRPDFLRKAGITELRDIGRLARFDFSPYIRFRAFRNSARPWSSVGRTSGRHVRIQDQVRTLRKGLGLQLRDVDLVNRTITIRRERTKTDAGCRIIPLNDTAKFALEKLLERARLLESEKPEHYLFPAFRCKHTKEKKSKGASYDPEKPMVTWRSGWRSLAKAAGLPGLRFHDLRHHAITKLAEAGVAEQTLMSIAGHVSKEMLDHYSHIRMEAKRRWMLLTGSSRQLSRKHRQAKIPQLVNPIHRLNQRISNWIRAHTDAHTKEELWPVGAV